MGTCVGVSIMCLCRRQGTLLHLETLVASVFFSVPKRRPLSGDMGVSGVEIKPQVRIMSCGWGWGRWRRGAGAARSCCSAAIVDHRADSQAVYCNESCLFHGLSRENRAWEGSFTALKSISVPWVSHTLLHIVHINLMQLTPLFFSPRAWVNCSLVVVSTKADMLICSSWNPHNRINQRRQ